MRDLIFNFLSEPTPDSYAALRDKAITMPEFRPDQPSDGRVWDLIEQNRLEEAEAVAEEAKNGYLLSPATHVALGVIAQKRGDESGSRFEFAFASALRQALLDTGDGTRERPYVVTRVSDEYGILSWLDLTAKTFGMTFHNGKPLDVITTSQRGPVYFDATIALRAYPS